MKNSSLPPRILAIDTSSALCTVALGHCGHISVMRSENSRQHAQCVLPMIQSLLQEKGIQLSHVDLITVISGPGSFTGLRIGMGVVQGLAMAATVPVLPVSTLAVMAKSAMIKTANDHVLVAIEAREDEIYFAAYYLDEKSELKLLNKEHVCAPSKLMPEMVKKAGECNWTAVGNGWRYHDEIVKALNLKAIDVDTDSDIVIDDLFSLAEAGFNQGLAVQPDQALPNYIKEMMDYPVSLGT